MTRAAHPLDDQILAALRDAEGFPLSTADVIVGVGRQPAYLVLRRLWILAGRTPTLVHHQRISGRISPIYWSAAPTQLELPA